MLQKCQSGGWALNGRPVGLSVHKYQSVLSQTVGYTYWGAHLEIPDKLLKPTFSPSPYIACTPHTPIKSLLSLDWRIGPIQKILALGSRVGWTPACKELMNKRTSIWLQPQSFGLI